MACPPARAHRISRRTRMPLGSKQRRLTHRWLVVPTAELGVQHCRRLGGHRAGHVHRLGSERAQRGEMTFSLAVQTDMAAVEDRLGLREERAGHMETFSRNKQTRRRHRGGLGESTKAGQVLLLLRLCGVSAAAAAANVDTRVRICIEGRF